MPRQKATAPQFIRKRDSAEWIIEYQKTGKDIWEQLPSESDACYKQFLVYLRLGPSRRLVDACVKMGYKAIQGNITLHSSQHCWTTRVAAFDEANKGGHVDAIGEVKLAAAMKDVGDWLKRRLDLREKRYKIASAILEKAYTAVTSPDFIIRGQDARVWIDFAIGHGETVVELAGQEVSPSQLEESTMDDFDVEGMSDEQLHAVAGSGNTG